eukprot:1178336-Prorocentrum_minimum.AAC.3
MLRFDCHEDVAGGTYYGTSVASSYTMDLYAANDGSLVLTMAAGVAADRATNPSLASNTLSLMFDKSAPTVALTSTTIVHDTAATTAYCPDPMVFTATFSEEMLGAEVASYYTFTQDGTDRTSDITIAAVSTTVQAAPSPE